MEQKKGRNRPPQVIVTSEFTDFQRKVINALSWLSVTLTVITVDTHGKYSIKSGHWLGKFLYILTTLNTTAKFVFLVLLVRGYYGPVEFLDQMSALLWILMCWELLQNLNIWIRKYPLFEVLSQLWKLENEIYWKLGKPKELMKKLHSINMHTVVIHMCICIVGDCFLVMQFFSAPKYSVYTYAAISEENSNSKLLVLFAIHEFLFMWQCWNAYAGIVCLSSINSAELTYTIAAMTETMEALQPPNSKSEKSKKKVSANSNTTNITVIVEDTEVIKNTKAVVKPKVVIDPNAVATGTVYDIETLLLDYKKLMLLSERLNDWCSYKIVGVHTIGYCQFISDVFMLMQLLKFPDFDFVSVLWFLEDSSVCMFMMFRMFTIMSRVLPASESFFASFRHYLSYENPIRKQLRKTLKTLKLVSINLGPCPVTPGTVGAAMMLLMNYYVCVALWPD